MTCSIKTYFSVLESCCALYCSNGQHQLDDCWDVCSFRPSRLACVCHGGVTQRCYLPGTQKQLEPALTHKEPHKNLSALTGLPESRAQGRQGRAGGVPRPSARRDGGPGMAVVAFVASAVCVRAGDGCFSWKSLGISSGEGEFFST